jgi:predicted nucleic acid-binding protein
MILDSNIIIYAAKPEHAELRRLIAERAPAVSAVSYVEVLGFHRLTEAERRHFTEFFAASTILPLAQPVLDEAVALRQVRKMSLGDSLVAATALVHGKVLVTRNAKDFEWVSGLRMLNPFDNLPANA